MCHFCVAFHVTRRRFHDFGRRPLLVFTIVLGILGGQLLLASANQISQGTAVLDFLVFRMEVSRPREIRFRFFNFLRQSDPREQPLIEPPWR